MKTDPLKPSPQLLIALGSLIVHYEEFLSPKGHPVDISVIESLRNQEDVKEWFEEMNEMAFLPLKR
jgi:hypothetical protein